MSSQARTEIHLLGFGEPERPDRDETVAYLERIFFTNAGLDGDLPPERVVERCHELAERRAPGLLEDYERIGGSPLLEQCRIQARRLEAELARRGYDITVRTGMQFTAPFVADIAADAAAAGTEHIVALPLYPLCGASTTVAALEALHEAVAAATIPAGSEGAPVPRVTDLAGWHPHHGFVDAVAESTATAARVGGLALHEPDTLLYFSAHGTPLKYLREGSRYDRYVEELCAMVASRLGVDDYALGYQNHANRGIEWTSPSNEDLLPTLAAARLLVVPISFVHEQSETLVELDEDLRELAESLGKEMTRVPVPFDAPALIGALADLVEPFLRAGPARAGPGETGADAGSVLRPCQCRPGRNAWCLNGDRPAGRLV